MVNETESALTLLYSRVAFEDALTDQYLVDLINKNSDFWRVHNASLLLSLFIYLGRLSDDNSREGKSFSKFQSHCFQNISDFSKKSFLSRRSDALKMNPNYLDNKSFPNQDKLKELFSFCDKNNSNYSLKTANSFLRKECKIIRSEVYAHAIITEEHKQKILFQKINLFEIEKALLFYWSITQHILESFRNAVTITPGILSFSEKDNIFTATKKLMFQNVKEN